MGLGLTRKGAVKEDGFWQFVSSAPILTWLLTSCVSVGMKFNVSEPELAHQCSGAVILSHQGCHQGKLCAPPRVVTNVNCVHMCLPIPALSLHTLSADSCSIQKVCFTRPIKTDHVAAPLRSFLFVCLFVLLHSLFTTFPKASHFPGPLGYCAVLSFVHPSSSLKPGGHSLPCHSFICGSFQVLSQQPTWVRYSYWALEMWSVSVKMCYMCKKHTSDFKGSV